MSRAVLSLTSKGIREQAKTWVDKAPAGTRIEFKAPRRTTDQNAKFWAMLTDIARQLTWHGVKLTTEDWKLIFLDSLKREMRIVPNIDGTGFVNLGRSSSDLSKAEFSDLIEIMMAFGAKHGVVWSDPNTDAPPLSPGVRRPPGGQ